MEDDNDDAFELQALATRDAFRLAIAQNIAVNGRMFCAALILINLVASHRALAVLAAVPIGASCVVDALPSGRLRASLTGGVYFFTAAVAVLTYLNAW